MHVCMIVTTFVMFQYRDDVFWLPQNMDFRGRVYPMPPHLTHISKLSVCILGISLVPSVLGGSGHETN